MLVRTFYPGVPANRIAGLDQIEFCCALADRTAVGVKGYRMTGDPSRVNSNIFRRNIILKIERFSFAGLIVKPTDALLMNIAVIQSPGEIITDRLPFQNIMRNKDLCRIFIKVAAVGIVSDSIVPITLECTFRAHRQSSVARKRSDFNRLRIQLRRLGGGLFLRFELFRLSLG